MVHTKWFYPLANITLKDFKFAACKCFQQEVHLAMHTSRIQKQIQNQSIKTIKLICLVLNRQRIGLLIGFFQECKIQNEVGTHFEFMKKPFS